MKSSDPVIDENHFSSCDLECLQDSIPGGFFDLSAYQFVSADFDTICLKIKDNSSPVIPFCNGQYYEDLTTNLYELEALNSSEEFTILPGLYFTSIECMSLRANVIFEFMTGSNKSSITLEAETVSTGNPSYPLADTRFVHSFHEEITLNGISFTEVQSVARDGGIYKGFYVNGDLGLIAFYNESNKLFVRVLD